MIFLRLHEGFATYKTNMSAKFPKIS